ncbi:MAG: hypothetical protein WCO44_08015 [Bacteroidota bacterium]
MIRCIKFLIPFVFLAIAGNSQAQKIISATFRKVEYRIPYDNSGDRIFEGGNEVLREIARDVLREPWRVSIRVSGLLGLTVTRHDHTETLSISLTHRSVAGDTVYRRFPVTEVLFPSSIGLRLKWANRADTSGFTEESLSYRPLSRHDSLVCAVPVTSFDPQVDTLIIKEVEFYYDSVALQTFRDHVSFIHDYYASVSLLDSLEEFTAGLRPDDTGQLAINYLKVEETARVLSRIDALDFAGKLLVNNYDPEELMKKYRQLYRNSRSLVFTFIDGLNKPGEFSWKENPGFLAAFFTLRIYSYVRRSNLMDQLQGAVYKDCLDHFFEEDVFPAEQNVATALLAKLFPGAKPDTLPAYVARLVYHSYRETARTLMDQHSYADAFALLENGRRFLAAIPGASGIPVDGEMEVKAAEGVRNSFIGIATTCIGSHNLKMADTYLAKAEQYATSHAGYIRSDSVYRAVFSDLFFMRNADCDQLLGDGRFAEALECYSQFEKDYPAHDLALVRRQLEQKKSLAKMGLGGLSAQLADNALKNKSADTALYYYEKATALRQSGNLHEAVDSRLDSLAPVMARIKYLQLSAEGAKALDKRQFTLSVSRYREARALAESSRIEPGPEFDSLYRQAMKNFLIIRLTAAQKKIWESQFDSAATALHNAETAGFDWGLLDDPAFSGALKKFRIKISEQQCRNLQDTVDLQMIRADRNAALKNYINALRYCQRAKNLVSGDTSCGLDHRYINDSLDRYKAPAAFQEAEFRVNACIAVGDYDVAMNTLAANQLLFQQAALSRFGLEQTDIPGLIAGKNNPYLTMAAVIHFLDRSRYADALRFLVLLNGQQVEAKQVKELQEKLGRALADADMSANATGNSMAAFGKYHADSAWFSTFRNAYMSEWLKNRPGEKP